MNIDFIKNKIWYFLIILTPFVDTINGLFLFYRGDASVQGPTSKISIGIIYRALTMLYIVYLYFVKGIKLKRIKYFVLLMYFPLLACIKGVIDDSVFSYLSYALKWIYPIFLFMGFECQYHNKNKQACEDIVSIMDFFSWSFPCLLLIEYIFGIGNYTYYNAGFKGLFYSTNDISFCITFGMIYSLICFYENFSWRKIINIGLNAVAMIILSTKSGIMFVACTLAYILLSKHRNSIKRLLSITISILIGAIGVLAAVICFNSQLQRMLERYLNMFNNTVGKGFSIDSIFLFLTSGRTERIPIFFSKLLSKENILVEFLFGWISPENATVIEMDFHDLMCQYGLIGFLILVCFYLIFIKETVNKREKTPLLFMYIMALISAAFGGHVISGALSGTIFATIMCLMSANRKSGLYDMSRK